MDNDDDDDDDDGKASSLALTQPRDKMSGVVSRCLPHRQLRVGYISKVATQWLEVYSNTRPLDCTAQNIPLHHRVPYTVDVKNVDPKNKNR